MLLLDATRLDTFDAIPDLSLRSDLFAAEAESRMVAWVTRLAQLDGEGLAVFLDAPESEDLNFRYEWRDGKLKRLPLVSGLEPTNQFKHEGERRLREALASLTRPEDADRIENPTEHFRLDNQAVADVLDERGALLIERRVAYQNATHLRFRKHPARAIALPRGTALWDRPAR